MMYIFAFLVACAAANVTDQLTLAIVHDMKKVGNQRVLASQDPGAQDKISTAPIPSKTGKSPGLAVETSQAKQVAPASETDATATGPVVDKEGYEKDWLTEHRSESYPESSVGKAHHPDYENRFSSARRLTSNLLLLSALLL